MSLAMLTMYQVQCFIPWQLHKTEQHGLPKWPLFLFILPSALLLGTKQHRTDGPILEFPGSPNHISLYRSQRIWRYQQTQSSQISITIINITLQFPGRKGRKEWGKDPGVKKVELNSAPDPTVKDAGAGTEPPSLVAEYCQESLCPQKGSVYLKAVPDGTGSGLQEARKAVNVRAERAGEQNAQLKTGRVMNWDVWRLRPGTGFKSELCCNLTNCLNTGTQAAPRLLIDLSVILCYIVASNYTHGLSP